MIEKKIICFGVRDYEISSFEELGKKYGYELILKSPFLTNENYFEAYGYSIVMVRGNCFLNKDSIKAMKTQGLKYLLTRTAGYNHIDIAACREYEVEVAYVPGYSPNAVAELSVIMAMALLRNLPYMINRTSKGDFTITSEMFSREIRSCTVGILGYGRIGRVAGELFKGLGARIVSYDPHPDTKCDNNVEFLSIEDFLKQSDIISCHMPFISGVNDNFINKAFIDRMKDGAILINTARGEIMNLEDAVEAVDKGHLKGLGIDVINNEKELFFQDYSNRVIHNDLHQRLINLFPRIIVTPHIGSSTDNALKDMIEISLQNMDEYLKDGGCKNSLIN